MLKMYYDNIEKFGNDPRNVGVDNLLEKYTKKYGEYDVLYGNTLKSFFTAGSSILRPINLLIAKSVFSGFVTAWRLAD